MKKVLIITYYWPPSGGAGVQRVLKLAKYFRRLGWEPVIYTAEEAEYPITDNSLFKDIPEGVTVLKQKIWEPYNLYKKFIGQKKEQKVYSGFMTDKKPSLAQKLSVFIRGNFFIPDARMFWIKPSVKYLIEELKKNPVDAMFSSGPPHSTHLIAKGVKAKLNIPWIADFRDPWTNIDFYDQLKLTALADRKHKRLEKSVLAKADKVVTVSWSWADDFRKIMNRGIEVITNGFDEDDFSVTVPKPESKFVMAHIGSLNANRNQPVLWQALSELLNENLEFKNDLLIRLVGKNDFSVNQSIEANGLKQNLDCIDYLPHSEVGVLQQSASVLMLLLNNTPNIKGIIPGKLFEYLAAGNPILVVGNPTGDSARIVNETNAGAICDFDEKEKMKSAILNFYADWKSGKKKNYNPAIEKYSRKKIAEKFSLLLNQLTTSTSK